MTREEEIRQAYLNWASDIECSEYTVWKDACRWADEHPKNPWRDIYEEQPELVNRHERGCFSGFIDSDPVLIRYKTDSGQYFVKQAVFSKYKDEEPMFYGVGEVTHWMPIPESPKGE